jgi:hypothetical protein
MLGAVQVWQQALAQGGGVAVWHVDAAAEDLKEQC